MSALKSTADKNEMDKTYLKWASKQMEQRISEYSIIKPVSVFCGTWNVNARSECADANIGSWLFPESLPRADIYAIGLEEMVDLNPLNVVVSNAACDEASQIWLQRFLFVLNETSDGSLDTQYELLQKKHLVGLAEYIFAKSSLLPHIKDVRSSITLTGGMGMLGNKGGMSVRLSIYDSSLCFVCAHFHAGRENYAERNLDFQTILEGSTMAPTPHNSMEVPVSSKVAGKGSGGGSRGGSGDSAGSTGAASVLAESQKMPIFKPSSTIRSVRAKPGEHALTPFSILNHEHVFWFGDLNYRIEEKLTKDEIFDRVASGDLESLRLNDQLMTEMRKGNVFQEFQEGPLIFPPTYKFVPGTDSYVDRNAKKPRAPAWCDRVLWRSSPQSKKNVKLMQYTSTSGLTASDHRPVGAYFNCSLRQLDIDRMRTVHSEVLFSVDKWVNASTPKLAVDGRMLDLGTIGFDRKYVETIKLKNTGTVMCEWQFVPKNDEITVCKSWLKLFPMDGILAPGETAEVEVCVDLRREEFAMEVLAENGFSLEDIIVLRAVRGSDYFCMINGSITPASAEAVRLSYEEKKNRASLAVAADINVVSSGGDSISISSGSGVGGGTKTAPSGRPPLSAGTSKMMGGGISHVASTDSQDGGRQSMSSGGGGSHRVSRASSADCDMDNIYGGHSEDELVFN